MHCFLSTIRFTFMLLVTLLILKNKLNQSMFFIRVHQAATLSIAVLAFNGLTNVTRYSLAPCRYVRQAQVSILKLSGCICHFVKWQIQPFTAEMAM